MVPLSRLAFAALVIPALLCAQKKPVTLDAISRGERGFFGMSANWAPDGRRFIYRQGTRLMLYDAAARSEKMLLTTTALDAAATKVPPGDAFGWENRK